MFCIEYYIGTIKYLNDRLSALPDYSYGVHLGKTVIRYRDSGSNKLREVFETSRKWDDYSQIAKERSHLINEIKRLKAELTDIYNIDYSKVEHLYSLNNAAKHKYDTEFWNKLPPEQTSYENNNNYYFGEDHFRSRVEVKIAEELMDLHLQYRYDVRVKANGSPYYVDFVVHLPQFNCCFLIEFFGKMDDIKYFNDNRSKIDDYIKEGLYNGQDILVLCGGGASMPSVHVIREQIMAMVNSIALQHTVRNT